MPPTSAASAMAAFVPITPLLNHLRREHRRHSRLFACPAPQRAAAARTAYATAASPGPSPPAPDQPANAAPAAESAAPAADDDAADSDPDSEPDPFATAQASVSAAVTAAFDAFFNPLRAACPVLATAWTPAYGNFILHPPATAPAKAVLHFVGGAFFGAVPHHLYNTLLSRLAARGHVIVATPYDLSFDYLPVADGIARGWEAVVADRAARYGPLPVVGLGHSAGAMLHALTAALFDDAAPKAGNILISFNARPARAAIPAYDALAPAARSAVAAEAALPAAARAALRDLPARAEAALADAPLAPAALRDEVLPVARQARRFVDQIWPVFRELAGAARDDDLVEEEDGSGGGDAAAAERVDGAAGSVGGDAAAAAGAGGTRDFYPSPDEIAAAVERLYPVAETLVIKFRNDSLDDSEQLADVLRRKQDVAFSVVELDGTHLTPLAQDAPNLAAASAAVAGGPLADGVAAAAEGVLAEAAGVLGLRQLDALEVCIDEWVDAAIANGKL